MDKDRKQGGQQAKGQLPTDKWKAHDLGMQSPRQKAIGQGAGKVARMKRRSQGYPRGNEFDRKLFLTTKPYLRRQRPRLKAGAFFHRWR